MRKQQAGGNRGAAVARLRRQLVAALTAHLEGEQPRPPFAGVHLWQVFGELSEKRRWGANGPDPIQHSELAAWVETSGQVLPAHHRGILAAMDAAWLDHARKAPADRVAGQLTGAAFDAMF